MPNLNQFWSLARFALSFGGGILVAKGWLSGDQLQTAITSVGEIAGPLAAIASVAWGIFTHTQKNIVASAADIVPVSTASQLSVGIASPQVVPTKPPVKPAGGH